MAADASGDLFIADAGNNRIREVVNPEILGPTLVLNDVNYQNAGAYDVVVSSPFGGGASSGINITFTLAAPSPQLSSMGFDPDGGFLLAVTGQAGQNYTLQASTNLVNWLSIFGFICTNSPMQVEDPAAKYYSRRFYRVATGTLPVPLQATTTALPSPTKGMAYSQNLRLPGASHPTVGRTFWALYRRD